MAQPHSNQVHVNSLLSNVSIAYLQSMDHFIADKVFPILPVSKQSDIYPVYTKNDWLRDEARERADATESSGSGYNIVNTNTYYSKVYAHHKDIGEQIRSNADSTFNLDRDATEFVTRILAIRRERVFATNYMTTGLWGTDITGVAGAPGAGEARQWSDYTNSDPIADLTTGTTTILQNTGFMPNTLVLGWQVFAKLKDHPDVVDRIKYTTAESVTTDMLAKYFGVERVVVAKAVYASNVEGETAAYSFITGKSALLTYSAPRPSLLAPSAGYMFAWNGLLGQGAGNLRIKKFAMDKEAADRVEGEMAFDFKLTGSDLGYYFTSIVA